MRRCGISVVVMVAQWAHADWEPVSPLPEPRARGAGALVGGQFYFLGGESAGAGRPLECWRLDVAADAWYPIASLPAPGISNIDAAVVGGRVYVIGGFTGSAGLNRVLWYDPVANAWYEDTTDPAPVTVFAHACVGFEGRVYVIGGYQNGAVSGTTLAYDPAAADGVRWAWQASLNEPRQFHAAAVVNGEIWVAGGVGNDVGEQKRGTESYDPNQNAWTVRPELATPRGGPGLYGVDGRPYVAAGGWNEWHTSGEALQADGWKAGEAVGAGARTFAYDGNETWLVKAGGWAGAYLADAEVFRVEAQCAACDANCDGSVNGRDIEPFRALLIGGAPCGTCAGDVNGDGSINGLDIAGMVQCLTG